MKAIYAAPSSDADEFHRYTFDVASWKSARSIASSIARRGPSFPNCLAEIDSRTRPPRFALRPAPRIRARHHHGSTLKPSPIPSTRPRCDVPRARSCTAPSPAIERNPASGNTDIAPVEATQRGGANTLVRNPACSNTRSAASRRSFASCLDSVANSARRRLVAA